AICLIASITCSPSPPFLYILTTQARKHMVRSNVTVWEVLYHRTRIQLEAFSFQVVSSFHLVSKASNVSKMSLWRGAFVGDRPNLEREWPRRALNDRLRVFMRG